jgi:hypothetical protein
MPGVHLPSVVARLGETQYPDAYGGLTVRATGPDGSAALTMTIYVVAARAGAFLAAIRDQAAHSPGTRCTIVHVPHAQAQLNALADRIEDARDRWRARGVHLLTAEPDARTSKVMITVLPFGTAVTGALTAAYGEDWVSVVPPSAPYRPLAAVKAPSARMGTRSHESISTAMATSSPNPPSVSSRPEAEPPTATATSVVAP